MSAISGSGVIILELGPYECCHVGGEVLVPLDKSNLNSFLYLHFVIYFGHHFEKKCWIWQLNEISDQPIFLEMCTFAYVAGTPKSYGDTGLMSRYTSLYVGVYLDY